MFSDGKGTLDIKTSGDDGFESPLDFLVEHIFLDYEITKYAILDFFSKNKRYLFKVIFMRTFLSQSRIHYK